MSSFLNLVRLVTGKPDLDTSSEKAYTKWIFVDDEKDGTNMETPEPPHQRADVCLNSSSLKTLSTKNSNEKSEIINESQEEGLASTEAMSSTSLVKTDDKAVDNDHSKKTKNQKKRDRKKNGNRARSSSSAQSKSLSWGHVEEILFSREEGFGNVPSSGFFPLGLGVEKDRVEIPLDLHLSYSQVKLIERAQQLGISIQQKSEGDYQPLETRQYDYRRDQKNPLFHSANEEERLVLLGLASHSSKSSTRSRAGSIGGYDELAKELLDLRSSRDSSTGCSCKSVKADKLTVGKLKQELHHHKDKISLTSDEINSLTKQQLINKVREVLQSCPLCISNNCSCLEAGIGCHVDACSCFHNNHYQVCQNVYNEQAYNPSAVEEYRKNYYTSTSVKRGSRSRSGSLEAQCLSK